MGCFLVMTERDYQMLDMFQASRNTQSPLWSRVEAVSRTIHGRLVKIDAGAQTTELAGALKHFFPETRAATTSSHHIFPQKHEQFFESIGLPIHQYTVQLDSRHHSRIHPGTDRWTGLWDQFVDATSGMSDRDSVRGLAIQYAGDLMTKFGLNGLDVRPHRSHPK
jgi:hypothetical protein